MKYKVYINGTEGCLKFPSKEEARKFTKTLEKGTYRICKIVRTKLINERVSNVLDSFLIMDWFKFVGDMSKKEFEQFYAELSERMQECIENELTDVSYDLFGEGLI